MTSTGQADSALPILSVRVWKSVAVLVLITSEAPIGLALITWILLSSILFIVLEETMFTHRFPVEPAIIERWEFNRVQGLECPNPRVMNERFRYQGARHVWSQDICLTLLLPISIWLSADWWHVLNSSNVESHRLRSDIAIRPSVVRQAWTNGSSGRSVRVASRWVTVLPIWNAEIRWIC